MYIFVLSTFGESIMCEVIAVAGVTIGVAFIVFLYIAFKEVLKRGE